MFVWFCWYAVYFVLYFMHNRIGFFSLFQLQSQRECYYVCLLIRCLFHAIADVYVYTIAHHTMQFGHVPFAAYPWAQDTLQLTYGLIY